MKEPSRLEKVYQRCDRCITIVLAAVSQLATLFMLIVAVLSTSDTIMSKVFSHSIILSNELISYFLVIIVAAIIAYIQISKGHISISIFMDHYPKVVKTVMQVIINLSCMGITAFTAVCTARKALSLYEAASRIASPSYAPKEWPFAVALAIGFGLLALAFLWCVVRVIHDAVTSKGDDKA